MSKSLKLSDSNYWDSTGIVHNQELLSDLLDGTTLYSSTSGTTTGGTLSDVATNFSKLEIYYMSSDSHRAVETIYINSSESNNIVTSLIKGSSSSTTYWYVRSARFVISSSDYKTFTIDRQYAQTFTSGSLAITSATCMTVYKIIGYK